MRGDIMLNYPYNVDSYNTILKSEAMKLSLIIIPLTIVFIILILFFSISIKKTKKKYLLIFLVGIVATYIFLSSSLILQINNFCKDLKEKAYIQYEGPATVLEERIYSGGSISTSYYISFEHNGELVELTMDNDKGYWLVGNIENIYIVYSKRSHYIVEIVE